MPNSLFDELRRHVAWSTDDEALLRRFHPLVQPELERVADAFYGRILAHDEARLVLQRGESSIGRLKVTLRQWLDRLLSGPRDDEYVGTRLLIGRVHVRVGLAQHYMVGAMGVVREELDALAETVDWPQDERRALRRAVCRALDLDLALMLESWREALLEQQARTERVAALGQVTGFLAHELRNPLAAIDAATWLLRGRAPDERARGLVDRIARQTGLAEQIISSVLGLVRDAPLRRGRVSARSVVEAAVGGVVHADEIAVEMSGLESLPELDADTGQMRLAFANLVKNAVQAAAPAGSVRVTGACEDGTAVVAVEDSGPGVDAAFRHRLFEVLATTRPHGTGLGLALVRRIVERHGGTVSYEPRPGAGARFVVRLPAASDPQAAPEPSSK